jgi:glycosyltransferase involved in cell wall biosynthesis
MKITYFHRHTALGFSIQHVFSNIITGIENANSHNILKNVEMPLRGSMPWDVVVNVFFTFKNRNKTGVNHISGHIHDVVLGLIGCKTVITIHDLVFIDNVKNPIKRFYKWVFWLYLPVKFADKITCISQKTKENILQHIKTDKLVVIHNPIDPAYQFSPKIFNVEKPVILHIGTGWNKNLRRTIEALKDIPCHLRIIGKLSEEIVSVLTEYKIEYSNAFQLSDEEIRQEYKNCDIVNFPSEYEGFGMPVIEGQKTGRVVLTSHIEPIIEIAGDAVHFVNPKEVESIRDGYLKIISDAEYRNGLILKGLVNTKRFELSHIVEQYMKVYEELEKNG